MEKAVAQQAAESPVTQLARKLLALHLSKLQSQQECTDQQPKSSAEEHNSSTGQPQSSKQEETCAANPEQTQSAPGTASAQHKLLFRHVSRPWVPSGTSNSGWGGRVKGMQYDPAPVAVGQLQRSHSSRQPRTDSTSGMQLSPNRKSPSSSFPSTSGSAVGSRYSSTAGSSYAPSASGGSPNNQSISPSKRINSLLRTNNSSSSPGQRTPRTSVSPGQRTPRTSVSPPRREADTSPGSKESSPGQGHSPFAHPSSSGFSSYSFSPTDGAEDSGTRGLSYQEALEAVYGPPAVSHVRSARVSVASSAGKAENSVTGYSQRIKGNSSISISGSRKASLLSAPSYSFTGAGASKDIRQRSSLAETTTAAAAVGAAVAAAAAAATMMRQQGPHDRQQQHLYPEQTSKEVLKGYTSGYIDGRLAAVLGVVSGGSSSSGSTAGSDLLQSAQISSSGTSRHSSTKGTTRLSGIHTAPCGPLAVDSCISIPSAADFFEASSSPRPTILRPEGPVVTQLQPPADVRPELVKEVALKLVKAVLGVSGSDENLLQSSGALGNVTAEQPLPQGPEQQLHSLVHQAQMLIPLLQRTVELSNRQQLQLQHHQQQQQQPQQQQPQQPESPKLVQPEHQRSLSAVRWKDDGLQEFAVAAYDNDMDSYLIPVAHVGCQTSEMFSDKSLSLHEPPGPAQPAVRSTSPAAAGGGTARVAAPRSSSPTIAPEASLVAAMPLASHEDSTLPELTKPEPASELVSTESSFLLPCDENGGASSGRPSASQLLQMHDSVHQAVNGQQQQQEQELLVQPVQQDQQHQEYRLVQGVVDQLQENRPNPQLVAAVVPLPQLLPLPKLKVPAASSVGHHLTSPRQQQHQHGHGADKGPKNDETQPQQGQQSATKDTTAAETAPSPVSPTSPDRSDFARVEKLLHALQHQVEARRSPTPPPGPKDGQASQRQRLAAPSARMLQGAIASGSGSSVGSSSAGSSRAGSSSGGGSGSSSSSGTALPVVAVQVLQPLLAELQSLRTACQSPATIELLELTRLDRLMGQVSMLNKWLVTNYGSNHPAAAQLASLQEELQSWRAVVDMQVFSGARASELQQQRQQQQVINQQLLQAQQRGLIRRHSAPGFDVGPGRLAPVVEENESAVGSPSASSSDDSSATQRPFGRISASFSGVLGAGNLANAARLLGIARSKTPPPRRPPPSMDQQMEQVWFGWRDDASSNGSLQSRSTYAGEGIGGAGSSHGGSSNHSGSPEKTRSFMLALKQTLKENMEQIGIKRPKRLKGQEWKQQKQLLEQQKLNAKQRAAAALSLSIGGYSL